MIKKTWLYAGLTLVCVLSLVITGYAQQTPTTATKKPITICTLGPLTGLFSGVGWPMVRGAEIAAKLINEEGGIMGRPIKTISRDTEIRPASAIRVAREAHDAQGVQLFTGVCSSSVALALGPVMEKLDSILFTTISRSDKIVGTKFNKHIFLAAGTTQVREFSLAGFINKEFSAVKKWANIGPDYEYGHSSWRNFIYKLKELNPDVKVVSSRYPPFGAGGGYGPHITAILNAKPEGLFTPLYGGDLIAFIREAKEYGLFDKIKVFAHPNFEWANSVALGAKVPEIFATEFYLDSLYNYPLSQKYEEAFKKGGGEKYFLINQGSAVTDFAAVYAYKAAIEKVKSFNVKDIIRGLEDLRWDTPKGKMWMRAGDHQAYFGIPAFQVIPDKAQPFGYRVGVKTIMPAKDSMLPVEKTREWDRIINDWVKKHPEVGG
ncbi:MAG: ABC transporter substrate-binding protein [Proteobacteria bacterium]|nr:ABC transporter substrate-binding protein [Pseudomonadota bacterium]